MWRLGTAFELETTPSETGIFSEFIRTHPSSIRSLHPLHSVAALGRKAEEICLNVSNNSYAIGSPLYRMFAMNAKAVALGAARPLTGWCICWSSSVGVPYIYNKLLDIEVYEKNKDSKRVHVRCDIWILILHMTSSMLSD